MKRLIFIVAIIATPALAQQSPAEQVLSAKLLQELQAGLTCNVEVVTLKIELEKLKKQLSDEKK